MNRYLLIILSAASLNTFSQAVKSDFLDFTLSCKVGDVSVIQMKDGISNRYNGFEGGYEAGDTIKIAFRGTSFYLGEDINGYSLNVVSQNEQMPFMLTLRNSDLEDKEYAYNYKNWSVINTEQQFLRLKSFGNSQILMERYYKNDWQLIYNQVIRNQSYTLSANCMNVDDNLDKLFDAIKATHGENEMPYGDLK